MRKPHTVVATLDKWAGANLTIECPYEDNWDAEGRPCTLYAEPSSCDFHSFENGNHHPDCASTKDRNAECSRPDPDLVCGMWRDNEPEDCEGQWVEEIGHGHRVEGCFAQHVVSEWGWEDGVKIEKDSMPDDLPLPLQVKIVCDGEDGITLAPWVDVVTQAPAGVFRLPPGNDPTPSSHRASGSLIDG